MTTPAAGFTLGFGLTTLLTICALGLLLFRGRRMHDALRAARDAAQDSLADALRRENAANVRCKDLHDALRAALIRETQAVVPAGPQAAQEGRSATQRHEPQYVAILHLHRPAPFYTVRSPGCEN